MRRRASSSTIAAAAVVLLVVSMAAPVAAAGRNVQAIRVTGSNAVFSPNGDGHKDVGTVAYRLRQPGRVMATVSTRGKRVLTKDLGRRDKGTHAFRWDGRRSDGKVVRDRTYTITLASRGARARTTLEVDAVYDRRVAAGRTGMSSGTVYPRTTVIRDVVVGTFFPGEQFMSLADAHSDPFDGVRREVLSASGRIVSTAPVREFRAGVTGDDCDAACGRLSWDGRDSEGKVVAAGTYRLRLVRTSPAGNRVVLGPALPVTVSDRKLVARTTTVTTTPSATPRGQFVVEYTAQPMDPPPVCSPEDSTRFPGGLSFRTIQVDGGPAYREYACPQTAAFVGALPERRTPYDRYAVAVTGGSGTNGPGSGAFRVGLAREVPMSGERTASVAQPFPKYSEVPRRGAQAGAIWGFRSTGDPAYDLASFDYTLTQYVPAP